MPWFPAGSSSGLSPPQRPPVEPPAGRTRCTCSRSLRHAGPGPVSGHSEPPMNRAAEPRGNGRRTGQFFASKQLRDGGGHCHHFLRRQPAVTLPGLSGTFCRAASTLEGAVPLSEGAETIVNPDQTAAAEDLPLRASFVTERAADALLRKTPRSPLLCGGIALKYVGAPLGLCFRFPLPARDCLTMGGNRS